MRPKSATTVESEPATDAGVAAPPTRAVDALRAGANGFLIRPVDMDLAAAQLEEALQQYRFKHQNRQEITQLRERYQAVLDKLSSSDPG